MKRTQKIFFFSKPSRTDLGSGDRARPGEVREEKKTNFWILMDSCSPMRIECVYAKSARENAILRPCFIGGKWKMRRSASSRDRMRE